MKFIEKIKEPIYDFIFIDGAHDWYTTGYAFFLVDKLLKPNGYILFDDLNWTFYHSPTANHNNHPLEEQKTKQVRNVWELLVKQHSNYHNHIEIPEFDWAIAQKKNSLNIKISFCISCMNRFWQVKNTLVQNLKDNYEDKDIVEFILIDFNSNDGLKDFVLDKFKKEVKEGYLKYYFTQELDSWNAPITRNTTHIIANGDILVNLDADNYTGYRGGKFLLDIYKNNDRNIFVHQGEGIFGKGNSGRISYYKEDFLKLGGYNQDFMPMGHLDSDLINRFVAYGIKRINVTDDKYNKTIKNTKDDSIKKCKSKYTWSEMCKYNVNLSNNNISNNKLIANKSKKIGIPDNLCKVII